MKHMYPAGAVEPLSDGAAYFDGTDDYVQCGDDSSIRPTSARTIACWIYRADWNDNISGGGQSIMGNYRSNNGMHLRWKSKRIQAFARIDGANRQIQTGFNKFKSGKPYYRASGWHFIAAAFDGQYFKLYICKVQRVVANKYV